MTDTDKSSQLDAAKAARKQKRSNFGTGVLICTLIVAIQAVAAVPMFLQMQKEAQQKQLTQTTQLP